MDRDFTPCVPTRKLNLRPLRKQKGGSLGKRASKAYAGTVKAVPADVTVKARVSRGVRVRVVPSSPGQFDRLGEQGMERPR